MSKETRRVTVNGRSYFICAKVTARTKRVTVYNDDKHTNYYPSGDMANYIVTDKRRRGRVLWFGKDTTPSIEEMVQDALNEAICIREDKEAERETYEQRIEQAVEAVTEAHDE